MNNEKREIEKKREEIIRQIGLYGLSTMLLKNQKQAPFEITSAQGSNLIPRAVVTNIIVYPFNIDIRMDLRRNGSNNVQHGTSMDLCRHGSNTVQHGTRSSVNHNMDLHTVAMSGDITHAREVVDKNRELLWFQDPQGLNLPLHLAVMYNHREVASYLVKEYPQGSYSLNRSNNSPLYLAVVHHPEDLGLVEEMLRELGTDRSTFDALKQGNSVVRAAIKGQNQAMLQTIINHHRDLLKCTDEEGLTPLSYAAYNGFLDIVGYIIKTLPKSIDSPNKDDSYPIHKACLGGHVEVLKKFHSKNPKSLFYTDGDGRTILHLAAKGRNNKLKPVVSYLLNLKEGKELIKKIDENGRTPLDLAKSNRNREVEELLRSMPQ